MKLDWRLENTSTYVDGLCSILSDSLKYSKGSDCSLWRPCGADTGSGWVHTTFLSVIFQDKVGARTMKKTVAEKRASTFEWLPWHGNLVTVRGWPLKAHCLCLDASSIKSSCPNPGFVGIGVKQAKSRSCFKTIHELHEQAGECSIGWHWKRSSKYWLLLQ